VRRSILLFALTALGAAVPATAGAAEHQIVSVDSNGTPASGINEAIAMTPSGRYVLFASNADSLPGPNVEDPRFMLLYRRDLTTGVTRLVSRRTNGDAVQIQVEGDISSDGRYVAFTTDSSSPVGRGVYVRDLLRHETLLAGRVQQPLTDAYWPQLSADGRLIAFVGFRRDSEQIYARDLVAGRTRLLTPDEDGRPSSNTWVSAPSISANGRYVAFEYDGDALPHCDNGAPKVYEWKTRMTTCAVSGWGADGPEYVNLSRTGRFLAWHEYTLRVTDLQTGSTRIVPEYSDGEFRPSWSADERFLAFYSPFPDAFPDGATSLYDRIERSVTHVVADCFPAERALTRDASAAFVSCRTSEDQQDAVVVTFTD
jgi:Tol biopolymer transport system component